MDAYNADAYYSMGFIAWSRWYPAYGKARAGLGMRQEDPGPIKDAGVRADLAARFGPVIEAGLRSLEKALEINPQYDDAMAYMNLLIRERADLRDTAEEWKRDTAIADEWVRKALAIKKTKMEQRNYPVISDAPPLPPPSPSKAQADRPRRIRIADNVVQENRLRNVLPVYPELARRAGIQGVVRLSIVVGYQGLVSDIKVISGHPLLIPAALDAVQQWEYRPAILNGQPVQVETEVSIPFKL